MQVAGPQLMEVGDSVWSSCIFFSGRGKEVIKLHFVLKVGGASGWAAFNGGGSKRVVELHSLRER